MRRNLMIAFLQQVKEDERRMGEEGEISSVDAWSLVLSFVIICRLSARDAL